MFEARDSVMHCTEYTPHTGYEYGVDDVEENRSAALRHVDTYL